MRDDKNRDQISPGGGGGERVNVSPGRKKRGEYIGEMKWISMHAPPPQLSVDIKFQVLSKLRSAG